MWTAYQDGGVCTRILTGLNTKRTPGSSEAGASSICREVVQKQDDPRDGSGRRKREECVGESCAAVKPSQPLPSPRVKVCAP